MGKHKYKCKNCGYKFAAKLMNNSRFNCCPRCGFLYRSCQKVLIRYFDIIQLSKSLSSVKQLLLKSELDSAVREALIIFEANVRKHSMIPDATGCDLMAKAFSFDYDKREKKIIRHPRISINDLGNETERNEQEGIQFMAMGLMRGIRNIYIHSRGLQRLFYSMEIISVVNLLLRQIKYSISNDVKR